MKKVNSRKEAEREEGQPIMQNNVPDNRQQADQQVAETADALETKVKDPSYERKVESLPGSELKQTKISRALSASGASSNPGMGISFGGGMRSGTALGDAKSVTVLGSSASALSADKVRDKTRVGKKFDRKATKLNYTPCDVIEIEVKESKPLAEAATDDQGYNGTYRNTDARAQKKSGAVPGDLMFQRSVDQGEKDQLYYVEGQHVYGSGMSRTDQNPSTTIDVEETDDDLQVKPVTYHSGNYVHRGLHVGMDENGVPQYMYFDVDDITPPNQTQDGLNCAASWRTIKNNRAELDRMAMDEKAGDEKGDLWSCLPRAINDPTAASYLMRSIEADTGAYVYLAYCKAGLNFSYQLNRAKKDGLDVKTPAIEQMIGWRSSARKQSEFTGDDGFDSLASCFTREAYKKGDPSLMIAAYDSTGKYNNKADLLLQPRGWRMHLQTADNNMGPLRVPDTLVNLIAANETYSTIDHDFDDSLPVYMTDKANLVLVHNMNELGGFFNTCQQKTRNTWESTAMAEGYVYALKPLIPDHIVTAAKAMANSDLNVSAYYKLKGGEGFVNTQTPVWRADVETGRMYVCWPHETTYSDADGKRDVEIILSVFEGEHPANGAALVRDGYAPIALDGDTATVFAISGFNGFDYAQPIVQDADDTTVTKSDVTQSSVDYSVGSKTYYAGCLPYAYRYSDLRNKYIVRVGHPLMDGLAAYLTQEIGAKFVTLLGRDQELYVPWIFSTEYMTLAQILLCAATPFIARARVKGMIDVIYFEDTVKAYPYSGLIRLSDAPVKNFVNFTFAGYDDELSSQVMDPTRAVRWVASEFCWKITDGVFVAPWYMNETELNSDGTIDEDAAAMSYPSIRAGNHLASLDLLHGMSEKELRLALDRMTKYFFSNTKFENFAAYKYGRTTDGQVAFQITDGEHLTISDLLKAPRELGLVQEAPLGYLTPDPADNTHAFDGVLKGLTSQGFASSLRIKAWRRIGAVDEPSILAATDMNITRGADYVQEWTMLTCSEAEDDTEIGGLIFGLNDEHSSVFSPFAALGTGAPESTHYGVATTPVVSKQRSVFTRLQFMPFFISPFDALHTNSESDPIDLFELGYYFNLAGFRASDYRESVYNRQKRIINEGLCFVSDPWVEASSLMKSGAAATGVAVPATYR